MTSRWFVVGCSVLLSATAMFAQARTSKTDLLTGTWMGELAPHGESRRMSVKMELKFDGKSVVTGTVSGLPNPADVKAGSTFDPKTGALKLQLGKSGDPAVLLVLEGTVAKGAAVGKVTGEGGQGEFKLTKKV